MDVKAYNSIVHQYSDSLYRFACKCTGNAEDGRDVVQNCFEALWQRRDRVEEAKAKAFLFQVAYNQSVDVYRKGRRTQYPAQAPEVQAHSGSPQHGLRKTLDKALARLDEQPRALVLLKDYEGYSYDEIAHLTGLTETQVKVYLHRARKTLKAYLVNIENVL